MHETIVALATAPLKSALAIVRLSGEQCFDVVSRCFSSKLDKAKSKDIKFGYFKNGDEVIDQVVLLTYVAPHSFTGENAIEIVCHGSLLIANQIIETLLSHGARMATNGEFSSRAFLNGKIDLVQAEAINDIINATTKEGKELSLLSLKGETSKTFYPIKESIADLLSQIEVNIDYPEYEDIEEVSRLHVLEVCSSVIAQLNKLITHSDKNRLIHEGVSIALIGKPNVGKSSILNALIHEEKAIVTSIAGTTRDIVEGSFAINGVPIKVYDTAGFRESNDVIEQIGIKKANEIVEKSDLVIYVIDESTIDDDLLKTIAKKKYIIVHNKADLLNSQNDKIIYISALNNDIEPLLQAIKNELGLDDFVIAPSFTNARQIGILKAMKENLQRAIDDVNNNCPIDLVSSNILLAYNCALELLGLDNKNDLTKEIFSRFCVGK